MIDWLIRRAKRTPYFHLAGYMNRYWLVPYVSAGSAASDGCGPVGWRRPIAALLQCFGVAVRVHEILRSDLGRDPHDHPWSYVTIILRGCYYEERYARDGACVGGKFHRPGSILFRRAGDMHRLLLRVVELPAHGGRVRLAYAPVTTLFVTGRYRQKWGFMTDSGKVPHDEYLT